VIDEGNAIHYAAVARGTPVYSSDGVEIGKVDEILDNFAERIFDGIILETPARELRFVDAPEVARTAERAVTLTIDAAECAELPLPEKAAPNYRANVAQGRLGRMFGRAWKRR